MIAARSPSRKFAATPLLAILALALAVRLCASIATFTSTFDTSTVGLMALRILKGERPLFYYGQSYMGALEAYVAAGSFAILGPSVTALSLSPILFSLGWIAATYGLFRELYGPRAGLVAALCVALPGWVTVWYCIGSYGGYPAAFFLGTLALWLMIRVTGRELSSLALWMHAMGIGTAAGLALWTHYLSAPYLLTGAAVMLPWLVRQRLTVGAVAPLAAGAVLGAVGLLPARIAYAQFSGEHVLQWALAPKALRAHVSMLVRTNLPDLLFWPPKLHGLPASRLLNALGLAAVLALAGLAAVLLALELRRARPAQRLRTLQVPLLFAGFFLLAYLPHDLAALRAPRYVIPLATLALCTLFSIPVVSESPGRRRAAWLLLGLWLACNGASLVLACMTDAAEATQERTRRAEVVANARAAGLKHVVMVGGEIFGHTGQTLTLYARDEVRFVSALDERYQPDAQAADSDPRAGLACETARAPELQAALDALRVEYTTLPGPRVTLMHDFRLPHSVRGAVPAAHMRVTLDGALSGQAVWLTDRDWDTVVGGAGSGSDGFTVDLGESIELDSLWLCPANVPKPELPESFTIGVSQDGREFREVASARKRVAVAYVCGEGVYVEGYYGLLECRFSGVPARFVRFAGRNDGHKGRPWQAAELFVFKRLGAGLPTSERGVQDMAAAIVREGIAFTVCDRWLSARLYEMLPGRAGEPPVYPRFNPTYKRTLLSRELHPGKGMGLAVARGLEGESASLLRAFYANTVTWDTIEFPHYILFVFRNAIAPPPGTRRLDWNGHTLLVSRPALPDSTHEDR